MPIDIARNATTAKQASHTTSRGDDLVGDGPILHKFKYKFKENFSTNGSLRRDNSSIIKHNW